MSKKRKKKKNPKFDPIEISGMVIRPASDYFNLIESSGPEEEIPDSERFNSGVKIPCTIISKD